MFEPRGHDVMSGAILYPPLRADCDIAVLYIEVTGCLPMCGHGTIGSVTFALEHGNSLTPREDGDVASTRRPLRSLPASPWTARISTAFVSITCRAISPMAEVPVAIDGLGELIVDIAYGG